jgi:hypothetical protein
MSNWNSGWNDARPPPSRNQSLHLTERFEHQSFGKENAALRIRTLRRFLCSLRRQVHITSAAKRAGTEAMSCLPQTGSQDHFCVQHAKTHEGSFRERREEGWVYRFEACRQRRVRTTVKSEAASEWCAWQDLNLHGLPHYHLKVACLPIPPHARNGHVNEPTRRRVRKHFDD